MCCRDNRATVLTATGPSFKDVDTDPVKEVPLFSQPVATFTVDQRQMTPSFACKLTVGGRRPVHARSGQMHLKCLDGS